MGKVVNGWKWESVKKGLNEEGVEVKAGDSEEENIFLWLGFDVTAYGEGVDRESIRRAGSDEEIG